MQEYNHAIREQFQGKKEEARTIYLKLLDSPLLSRQVCALRLRSLTLLDYT